MKRRVEPAAEPPERLRVFHSEDWPSESTVGAFEDWKRARADFAEANGWPGDELARLQVEYHVRRFVHHGIEPPWRGES